MPTSVAVTRNRVVALVAVLAVLAAAIWIITIRAIRRMPAGTTVIALPAEEQEQPSGQSPDAAAPATGDAAKRRSVVVRTPVSGPEPLSTPTEARSDAPAAPTNPPPEPKAEVSRGAIVLADADARLYTSIDRDVQPPVAIVPNALGRVPGSASREDNAVIEVIINERGDVESVKAVDAPQDLGGAMLITTSMSAAKAWHFRPAIKNGHPVRYRQLFLVALR